MQSIINFIEMEIIVYLITTTKFTFQKKLYFFKNTVNVNSIVYTFSMKR